MPKLRGEYGCMEVMGVSRLDKAIADVAYILDCLMAYRNIVSTGDCNRCANKGREWKPKLGQLVRYNCPHYKAEEENE